MKIIPSISALLGFANKCGKLASGESAVESSVKYNTAHLLIIAENAGEKRIMKWQRTCENKSVEFFVMGTKEEYGLLLGTSPRGVLAVTDKQMAKALKKKVDLWR